MVKKAFKVYDVDGNGSMDYDEMNIMMDDIVKSLKIEKLNEKQRDWAFKILDADGSGEIDHQELIINLLPIIEKFSAGYLSNTDEDSEIPDQLQQNKDLDNPGNKEYMAGLGTKLK